MKEKEKNTEKELKAMDISIMPEFEVINRKETHWN